MATATEESCRAFQDALETLLNDDSVHIITDAAAWSQKTSIRYDYEFPLNWYFTTTVDPTEHKEEIERLIGHTVIIHDHSFLACEDCGSLSWNVVPQ